MSDNKKGIPSVSKKSSPVSEKKQDDSIIFYDTDNIRRQPGLAAKRTGSRALKIIAVIVGSLMIIAGIFVIYLYINLSRINYQSINTDQDLTQQSNIADPSRSTNAYTGKLLTDSEVLNILLVGADTRENQTTGNSDTMILMSIDTKNRKLKLLSFMRDTYVAIPGYDDNKLNAAFSIGGTELTVKTIQANYGIQIDRYAVVDFKSFRNIIDTLGGIDLELTQEEVDYIDWQCWKNHQVETRNELNAYVRTYTPKEDGTEVTKIHLNGRQALWHARNRGEDGICSGNDYTRTQRQRTVISTVINSLKGSDVTTVMNVIYDIGPMITTNLKTSEITTLAGNIKKYLNYEIVSQSAPDISSIGTDYYYSDDGIHTPIYISGYAQSCIVIYDWTDFRTRVANFVFSDKNEIKP